MNRYLLCLFGLLLWLPPLKAHAATDIEAFALACAKKGRDETTTPQPPPKPERTFTDETPRHPIERVEAGVVYKPGERIATPRNGEDYIYYIGRNPSDGQVYVVWSPRVPDLEADPAANQIMATHRALSARLKSQLHADRVEDVSAGRVAYDHGVQMINAASDGFLSRGSNVKYERWLLEQHGLDFGEKSKLSESPSSGHMDVETRVRFRLEVERDPVLKQMRQDLLGLHERFARICPNKDVNLGVKPSMFLDKYEGKVTPTDETTLELLAFTLSYIGNPEGVDLPMKNALGRQGGKDQLEKMIRLGKHLLTLPQ